MTSLPFSQQEQCPPPPNWLELPDDVSSSIIRRLEVVEILTSVQYVCPKWRRICRDPSMWRSIDFVMKHEYPNFDDLTKLYQLAVDLSSGGLVDVNLEFREADVLRRYIIDRSKHLRPVRIALIEEVDVSFIGLSSEDVATFGRLCPLLYLFKFEMLSGDAAFAIAKNMSGLRHLCISGPVLTNSGLIPILDGCKHLEPLDLS